MNKNAQVVVVTGGSSGIGLATAEWFAQKGDHIILGARRKERFAQIKDQLIEKGAASVTALELDVRNQKSVEGFAEGVIKQHGGRIDVLINNAGLVIGTDKLAEGRIADWETIIDTNVLGVLRITRALLPQMIKNNAGHIVMLGSIAGHQVYEGGGPYCASKFSIKALTKTLKLELNGTSIRVTTVDPGMVETEFSLVRFAQDEKKASAVYKGVTPLTAQDIAECVGFAASRPAHVNIDEIIVMPTDQATVYKVNRR
ncbi:MAG: SDR family NAD(P)-dependent oxidoreductase [Oligoflexales bacterium]